MEINESQPYINNKLAKKFAEKTHQKRGKGKNKIKTDVLELNKMCVIFKKHLVIDRSRSAKKNQLVLNQD